jgi:hypothetical protein
MPALNSSLVNSVIIFPWKSAYINSIHNIYLEINMSVNPLQNYFRQPKIYIKLPSKGMYSNPGTFTVEVDKIAVYGMSGMDEIIMKTPDSLLSGESIAQVIKSCCPGIANPWELTVLDTDLIFASIRIATYGNLMSVTHTCAKCKTENEYDLDMNQVIEFFTNCKYDNKITLENMIINTQPLSYKESTNFSIENFGLQQRLAQTEKVEDEEQKQKYINDIFKDLAKLQAEIYFLSIESVEVNNSVVTEKEYIKEWLVNCDKLVYDSIKNHIDKNRQTWQAPTFSVKCTACENEANIRVELDQSNFFA